MNTAVPVHPQHSLLPLSLTHVETEQHIKLIHAMKALVTCDYFLKPKFSNLIRETVLMSLPAKKVGGKNERVIDDDQVYFAVK